MSSRKEQKEALRREREERERQAKEAERRKRLVGYGAAGALVLAVVVVLVVVLTGGGGSSGPGVASKAVLPDGGKVPSSTTGNLNAAIEAAGCEPQQNFPANSRNHLGDPNQTVKYSSNPPTSGRHYQVPAADGAYSTAPKDTALVHTQEHGRVIIWFKPSLPRQARANLKALFDQDDYQMVLVPRANMPYQVAVTAWNRDPEPLGAGRLVGCKTYNDKIFSVLRDFRDDNRSNGPEPVP